MSKERPSTPEANGKVLDHYCVSHPKDAALLENHPLSLEANDMGWDPFCEVQPVENTVLQRQKESSLLMDSLGDLNMILTPHILPILIPLC
ncbi:hypothetical protein Nepgr_013752 [Nepenthes gracilis]|uniref:Uncharacterized protein n=1 Tax=Nepenthes gracilis TaxID=150966 RepID=A0AAD3XPN5_NEPGR|nr:hypothetical protein Nepgr_013752 [Nepenthes gracilis]